MVVDNHGTDGEANFVDRLWNNASGAAAEENYGDNTEFGTSNGLMYKLRKKVWYCVHVELQSLLPTSTIFEYNHLNLS